VACLLLGVPGWTQPSVAMAKKIHKMWRATDWIVAAAIGSAVATTGCTRAPLRPDARYDISSSRLPVVPDNSVAHAYDTSIEMRLVDRLELDNFLRDRDIRVRVSDGVVSIAGEVWTPLERERAGEIVRHVPGVIDVVNKLDIRPPR
jgi:BON domain